MTVVIAAGAAAGSIAVAEGHGGSSKVEARAAAARATIKTRHTKLGTVLVNARGRTVYLWKADTNGKSVCSGQCAVAWPPVLTSGRPKASGKAKAARLGTVKRSDGSTQVTYAGHPLYTFVQDKKAGQTNGQGSQGFGAEWDAVTAGGKAVK